MQPLSAQCRAQTYGLAHELGFGEQQVCRYEPSNEQLRLVSKNIDITAG